MFTRQEFGCKELCIIKVFSFGQHRYNHMNNNKLINISRYCIHILLIYLCECQSCYSIM